MMCVSVCNLTCLIMMMNRINEVWRPLSSGGAVPPLPLSYMWCVGGGGEGTLVNIFTDDVILGQECGEELLWSTSVLRTCSPILHHLRSSEHCLQSDTKRLSSELWEHYPHLSWFPHVGCNEDVPSYTTPAKGGNFLFSTKSIIAACKCSNYLNGGKSVWGESVSFCCLAVSGSVLCP